MYLITGGGGFIGSNLVEFLLKIGQRVRVIDNFSTGRMENLQSLKDVHGNQLEIIKANLNSHRDLKGAFKGVKYISHHAAIPSVPRSIEDPIGTNHANIGGTVTVLSHARNCDSLEKIIVVSSSSVYGDQIENEKIETMSMKPKSPYALQKVTCELYMKQFYNLYKLPVIGYRYFNVFGKNQDPNSKYSAVIPKFINCVLKLETPLIYGDGKQTRDFTHIDNVIHANMKGFKSKKNGVIYNIACGETISLNRIIQHLEDHFKTNIKPLYVNERKGDIKHSLANIEKAKNFLKYEPVTNFKQGLKKTIEHYKKNCYK